MLKWFKFPVFEDPNKNQTARALLAITLMIIALSVLFNIVIVVFLGSTRSFIAVAGVTVVTLVVHLMARRGYVRHGAIILCALTWVILTTVALPPDGRGVYDMAFSAYITPILMASLLVGGVVGIVFAGLSAFAGLFLLLMMTPDPNLSVYDAGVYWAANSLGFVFTATLLWLFERRFQRARERTQRRETQLEQNSRQLEYEIIERARFQEAYRTVVENSLQGLGIFQNDRIVFANATMSNMFGYSLNELLAVENVNELFSLPEGQENLTFHGKARLAGKPVPSRYEVEGRHRSGAVRWFEVIPTRITYKGQLAIQYAFVDITERKKAEDALWAREEDMRIFQDRLKALHEVSIELSTIPVFDDLCRRAVELGRERLGFDRIGILLFDEENQKMRGTFGTNGKGELSDDRKISRDLAPDSWIFDALKKRESVHYQDDAALFDDGVVVGRGWNALAVLWSGDKNIGWLAADSLILKNPLTPNQLELLRLYAMTLGNLLSQRRTEEASKRSQEWFAKIFQLSPLSVSMSIMPEGRYVDVNPRWCQMFGYSREEAIGHTGPQLGLWFDPVERDALTKVVLAEGRMPEREVMLKNRSGTTYFTMMSAEIIDFQGQQFFLTMVYDITERKKAEQALKRSEEWFAKIFETAPVAIAISLTSTGTYEDINPAWCELFGFTREEVIGQTGVELGLWDVERRVELVEIIEKQGRLDRYELQITRRDGTPLHLVMSSELIELDGTPHFLTMISDITERKKAEAALQESERHAREFQEKLKILQQVSLELTAVESLEALCRKAIELGHSALGYDRIGFLLFENDEKSKVWRFGIESDGLIHTERELNYNYKEDDITTNLALNREYVFVNEDAELRDFDKPVGQGWNVVTGVWDGDTSLGWLAADNLFNRQPLAPYQIELLKLFGLTLGHLVTRKRTEEALKRSEEWFAKIFQSSPVSISISSLPNAQYVDVNPRWSELFGYTRDEAIGNTGAALGLWVKPSQSDEIAEATLTEGRLLQQEVMLKHRDGTVHHAMMSTDIIELHGNKLFLSMVNDITERKRTEEALKRSEEWFAKIFQSAPVSISISTVPEGRYVDVNPTWSEFFGYSREEAIGRSGFELGLWADIPHRDDFIGIVSAHGKMRQHESLVKQRDGTLHSVIMSAELINLNGRLHFLTMVNDITERKKAEEALRKSEEHAREFQDKLKVLQQVSLELTNMESFDDLCRRAIELGREALGFDRIGLLLFNENTHSMVGTFGIDETGKLRDERDMSYNIEADEVMYSLLTNRESIYFSEDTELHNFGTFVGRGWNVATGMWDGSSSIGWLAADNLISKKPLIPYQIELLKLYGLTLGHLLTRKRTEEALKRSEEWFSTVFRMSPFAIAIRRIATGGYVDVNDSWCALYGYNREDVLGRTSEELNVWADPQQRVEVLKTMSAEGKVREAEVNIRRRDGETRSVLLSTEKVDFNGKPHFVSTLADITERKQVEQHRLELALANERLELFREFMTNITHDLKTPLSVINTSVELMERIKDADRQKEKIAAIKEQTARLDKYIQDMLTISRLDHAPDLALRPVDFNRLATDARDRLQPTAEKKNVTMQLEFEPQAPYVLADEGELDRMLVNLVENALNYTPEGGNIWIRTRIDQDNVVAEIADTGIGIGEKDLPRIFDRFYRADTARSTKGTGLGLSIVKRIVEMHGGTIDVDSTPGKGTTFCIRLPLVEITEAKDG
jgi:PAS domain S-box-containing protein